MQEFKHSVLQAAQSINKQLDGDVDTAIILGSGLSGLSFFDATEVLTLPYREIPGLVPSTAPSHKGELRIVDVADKNNNIKRIALCAGRQHLYEGYSAQQVCILVYVLREIGSKNLIITNAAGALNPEYRPGDVMLINDHINFTGQNPLIGQDDSFGMRFPDMSEAYEKSACQPSTK